MSAAESPASTLSPPAHAHRVLVLGQQMPYLVAELGRHFHLHHLVSEADPQAFLAAEGHTFDAVVTSAFVGLDPAVLSALTRVQIISNFGVGVDGIDLAEAARRGIAVGYTPDVLNACVADLAWGLLIDTARRLSEADRFVRAGQWLHGRFPLATRVSGKRLGIVGLGRIGREVARRAGGFDMAIRYTNRRPLADLPDTFEPDLLALARWADFLMVVTPGGAETRHLISREVMRALGPDGLLINVARGSVVDEQALVAALQAGELGGAGLDVFDDEPHVPAALLGLPRVVLLPHVASGTHETRQAMADLTVRNLLAHFAGGAVVSP